MTDKDLLEKIKNFTSLYEREWNLPGFPCGDCVELLAEAATRLVQLTQPRLMETAPKDGSYIVVFVKKNPHIVHWQTEKAFPNSECNLFDDDCRMQHDWDEEEGRCYPKKGWVEQIDCQGDLIISHLEPDAWLPLPALPKDDAL